MRAIIIATGHAPEIESMNEPRPAPLLPLVDRPFIQHLVEYLVDQGVTEFDFVLSHLPEKFEEFLGDGSRWGSQFRYHLARDAAHPYRLLKSLETHGNPVVLAHADRLPQVRLDQNEPACKSGPTIYVIPQNSGSEPGWTGWAWLPASLIFKLPAEADEGNLSHQLIALARREGAIIEVPKCLSAQSYEKLLDAHKSILEKKFTGLMLSCREAEEGIWVSRNVSLHPTARLIAPVFIGENCRISQGVQIGPDVAVGNDCVMDARCTVANSVILSGSYVGEALELEDVIVDRNRLVNVRVGASVAITDDFILGSLSHRHAREWMSAAISRLAGVTLLIMFSPLLLLTALFLKVARRGRVLNKKEVVFLPASTDETQWKTFQLWSFYREGRVRANDLRDFFLGFLPALVNIARGQLRFVGVAPRSAEEIRQLPRDWQTLYLQAKSGVVTEAFVHYGARPVEDELYSAEAFYSVTAGMRRDLKLMVGYFARLIGIYAKAGFDEIHWRH